MRRKRNLNHKVPFGRNDEEKRRRTAFGTYFGAKLDDIDRMTNQDTADYCDEPAGQGDDTPGDHHH